MSAILAGALASWFTPEFQARWPDLMDRIAKTLLRQTRPRTAAFDMHDLLSA